MEERKLKRLSEVVVMGRVLLVCVLVWYSLALFEHSVFVSGYFVFCTLELVFIQKLSEKLASSSLKSAKYLPAVTFAVAFCLINTSYRLPIGIDLIKSIDEGEGAETRFYKVSYYAPNTPLVFVKVAPKGELGVREVRGYARYSPIDYLNVYGSRVIMIRNIYPSEEVRVVN